MIRFGMCKFGVEKIIFHRYKRIGRNYVLLPLRTHRRSLRSGCRKGGQIVCISCEETESRHDACVDAANSQGDRERSEGIKTKKVYICRKKKYYIL